MKSTRIFALLLTILIPLPGFSQDPMLCVGNHWTEDEGNLMMKEFASHWNDRASWEGRAVIIRQGLIDGMQLEKMPEVEGGFHLIAGDTHHMDGYTVENVALESFPGFYITGNIYRPARPREKNPAMNKSSRTFVLIVTMM